LAHDLIIAITRATDDPNYKAYWPKRKIPSVVQNLLETIIIDLDNGAGIPEHSQFQDHFHEYEIVVHDGLNFEIIMLVGQVDSSLRLNLVYDEVTCQYHEIASLTCALVKQFVCNACGKGRRRDAIHKCNQTCSDYTASPPCYPRGFQSLVWNATITLGTIRVSTTIRGNTETRRLSASGSAADLPYRTVNMMWQTILLDVKRTEKKVISVITNH
jgi:hypothetical protein